MKHVLASFIGMLVVLFLCAFVLGFTPIATWTYDQRVWSAFFMGFAFICPIFLGYLNGEL